MFSVIWLLLPLLISFYGDFDYGIENLCVTSFLIQICKNFSVTKIFVCCIQSSITVPKWTHFVFKL